MKKGILMPILAILLAFLVVLGANFALSGVAAENAQKEHLYMLQTVLPEGKDFVKLSYDGEDTAIRSIHKCDAGFVIETAVNGYAGEITMLVGVNKDGAVTGLVVRQLQETFGLGAQALNDTDFLAQFLNTSTEQVVGTDVDALTGATVTSKAIARSVNSAVSYVTGADASSGATEWGG